MQYLLVLIFFLAHTEIANAYARAKYPEVPTNNSAPTNFTAPKKATKSSEQILKKGDYLLGFRAGQLGAFNGSLSLGINGEYMYAPEFGFGAQIIHASYSKEIVIGDLKAEFESKAITVAALGNWHLKFIKVTSLDPFISVGLAHSFVSTKGKLVGFPSDTPMPSTPLVEMDGSSTFLVGSINARYFLDQHLGVVGSIGLGLSTLTIGMDYLF